MEEPLPYSLKNDARSSDAYYAAITCFTDEWVPGALSETGDIVDGYTAYQKRCGHVVRTQAELAFEFLALGVLLHEHGFSAIHLPDWSLSVLQRLVSLQERYPKSELWIKRLRGVAGGLFNTAARLRKQDRSEPGRRFVGRRESVDALVEWLLAHGQATQAGRFQQWSQYFRWLNILEAQKTIDRAIRLAERFEKESEQVLGVYTQRVDDYVDETQDATTWRYDAALITRGKLEYHLGMLGTEILNRAYRQRFLDTDRRLVIVPNCLPKQPEGQCKAVRTPMGSVCQGCTPGCRVYQITQMGKKQGIPVVIIPDDELARICVSSGQAGTGMGVVGLSCALTNWSAGWDAERLGLHAQGVLLDCAGCKKHWTREGVSTDANLKKIKEVLGVAE